MDQQKVELRKIRDFSDNINVTFVFIKQNVRPLLTSFLAIAGIFMLATAIYAGIYQSNFGSLFEHLVQPNKPFNGSLNNVFGYQYFLAILFGWLNITVMQTVIVAYMLAYYNNQNQPPTIDAVWKQTLPYLLPLLLYSILNALVMAFGLVLCILPGIFIIVVLMPFPAVVMIEKRSYGDAFNRCFALVKNNFWISLGLYLIVYIMYSFSSGIISAIVGAVTGVLFYFTTKNMTGTVGIITSILSIFSYVFYIVFFVSVVLHYFNLSEQIDGTGILARLDSIGEDATGFNNIQEEY